MYKMLLHFIIMTLQGRSHFSPSFFSYQDGLSDIFVL